MMTPTGNANSALALPNLLTLLRIAAVPALVASMLLLPPATAAITAFALFTVASITDWLDGYLARAWQMQSLFGTMLDPIADKLLVGAALLLASPASDYMTGSAVTVDGGFLAGGWWDHAV